MSIIIPGQAPDIPKAVAGLFEHVQQLIERSALQAQASQGLAQQQALLLDRIEKLEKAVSHLASLLEERPEIDAILWGKKQ